MIINVRNDEEKIRYLRKAYESEFWKVSKNFATPDPSSMLVVTIVLCDSIHFYFCLFLFLVFRKTRCYRCVRRRHHHRLRHRHRKLIADAVLSAEPKLSSLSYSIYIYSSLLYI